MSDEELKKERFHKCLDCNWEGYELVQGPDDLMPDQKNSCPRCKKRENIIEIKQADTF